MILFYVAVVIQLAILGGTAWVLRRLVLDVSPKHADTLRAQCIEWLGNLVADILEHPRLKMVLAQAVTNGINYTMEQRDLGERLHKVSVAMREDNLQMSRSLGEQLPGLAKSFVGGAVSSITRKKKPENNTKRLESQKTSFEVSSLTLDDDDVSSSDFVGAKKFK